ncbi:MAG: insulinase family protein [Firmicutes bacterium]|nr:insulinase family protein [Bacillota bacterium]MCL5040643.1 insulinase family protein [Bacillota bacterium]
MKQLGDDYVAPEFRQHLLKNGIRLHVQTTRKFKTTTVNLFLHQNLNNENATRDALLSYILRRGSETAPTTQILAQKLEELYGASLRTDVFKMGERHLLSLRLDLVGERFLVQPDGLLRRGLDLFQDVLTRPVTEKGVFRQDYLDQEKDTLRRTIEGLINDKGQYALTRCVEEMCRGEPYATFRYGRREDIEPISAADLFRYYQGLLQANPIDVFVVGDLDFQTAADLLEETLRFPREGGREIPAGAAEKEVTEVKRVMDREDVNQGKLILGYRTNIPYSDPDLFGLVVYNGILGAFPHSKLFLNVREKASLAYYAVSRLETTKGLLFISSGIESSNYQRALDIIEEQVADMAAGRISQEEYDNTQKALISQLKEEEDSPGRRILSYLEGLINDRPLSTEEEIRGIIGVTREDVIRVAGRIKPDTIYFLNSSQRVGEMR